MGTPFSTVMEKTEDAIEQLINDLKGESLSSYRIYKGFSLDELETNRIEILALDADPEKYGETYTGNFNVNVTLAVFSHGDDATRASHRLNCGFVEDIIMRDDIEDQINNQIDLQDYTIFTPGWKPGLARRLTNGKEIENVYLVQVYCMPSINLGD